jgi:hypothetical protein
MTHQEKATTMTHQEKAYKIAISLAALAGELSNSSYVPNGEPGGDMALSRTLDQIATLAAELSAMTAHSRQSATAATKRAETVKRQVRKALGYTYP